jgi:integrase
MNLGSVGHSYRPLPTGGRLSATRVGLAVYTEQRLGDTLAMRWYALRDGVVVMVHQQKTDLSLDVPLHRELARQVQTWPKTAGTILTSIEGRPH